MFVVPVTSNEEVSKTVVCSCEHDQSRAHLYPPMSLLAYSMLTNDGCGQSAETEREVYMHARSNLKKAGFPKGLGSAGTTVTPVSSFAFRMHVNSNNMTPHLLFDT